MAVQSKPINQKVKSKPGAIVTGAQLEQSRGALERIAGLLVLALSLLGTVAAFHGGWGPLLAGDWRGAALAWGIAAQVVLTALQWIYGRVSRLNPIYLGSLAVDTGLTVIGYGPLVVPWFAPMIAEQGISEPVLAAWLILAGAGFVIAWYPESRLVD